MFRSIGHIIHHVQDMAQPEHVRDDPHLIIPWIDLPVDPSLYEHYTFEKIESGQLNSMLGSAVAPVHLSNARSYWDNNAMDGMAEFTNANFLSKDSNFVLDDNGLQLDERFPLPRPAGFEEIPLSDSRLLGPEGDEACNRLKYYMVDGETSESCKIMFVKSRVQGKHPDVDSINDRASTVSFFDQYLRDAGRVTRVCTYVRGMPSRCVSNASRLTTLNTFNFDAYHSFLLPRAINFSSGLIDYLFRGKLDVSFTDIDTERDIVEFDITNVSQFADRPLTLNMASTNIGLVCVPDGASYSESGRAATLSTHLSYGQSTKVQATLLGMCDLSLNMPTTVVAYVLGNDGTDPILPIGSTRVVHRGVTAQSGRYDFSEDVHISDGGGDLVRTELVRFTPMNSSQSQVLNREDQVLIDGDVQIDENLTWRNPTGTLLPARRFNYANYVSRKINASGGTSTYVYNGSWLIYNEFGRWWTAEWNLTEDKVTFIDHLENAYPPVGILSSDDAIPGWDFAPSPKHKVNVASVTNAQEYLNAGQRSFVLYQEAQIIEAAN